MLTSCSTCGKTLRRTPSTLRTNNFCNHDCYADFKKTLWQGANNPKWSGGEKRVKCQTCSKSFTSKRYGPKREPKFCCHECYSKYRSMHYIGDKHPNFKGEYGGRITRPVRWRKRYDRWVRYIHERDIVCILCSKDKKLHVHHIKPLSDLVNEYKNNHDKLDGNDDYFYRKDNGVLLCEDCHLNVHRGESGELLETVLDNIKRQSAAEPLVY